tara:strand:- start:623 stop:1036 length:414 start_codon:yes stop_codon:yes gene_type:complete
MLPHGEDAYKAHNMWHIRVTSSAHILKVLHYPLTIMRRGMARPVFIHRFLLCERWSAQPVQNTILSKLAVTLNSLRLLSQRTMMLYSISVGRRVCWALGKTGMGSQWGQQGQVAPQCLLVMLILVMTLRGVKSINCG